MGNLSVPRMLALDGRYVYVLLNRRKSAVKYLFCLNIKVDEYRLSREAAAITIMWAVLASQAVTIGVSLM